MDRLSKRLRKKVRSQMNRIVERVDDFESRGGWRGAVERARAKSERRARDLVDALEARGINFNRLLPTTAEEQSRLREHYRTLEVPFGSDLHTVKTAYRAKMREYHPDRHASDPVREREATEIAQQLSIAYTAIEHHLKAHGPG